MPTFSHYYEMKIRIRIIMHHLKCNVIQMVIQILCYNNLINFIIVSKPKGRLANTRRYNISF